MRILLAALSIAISISVWGQTAREPNPGIAGHADCRAFFGVMWLDGVAAGQTRQATHYGLSQPQLDWWMQEGRNRNKYLCYVGGLQEVEGKLKAECPNCNPDWEKHFRWLVFEHTQDKDKRVSESMVTLTGDRTSYSSTPHASTPATSLSLNDPNTRMDYEISVIGTGVAVYATDGPIRPPTDQDHQLFYRSAQKDKSKKDSSGQVARNDRMALQAATDFVAKNVKR